MANRERVSACDDPLANLMTFEQQGPGHEKEIHGTLEEGSKSKEQELLKSLDSSKIQFKEKKATVNKSQHVAPPAPAQQISVPAGGAAKGLGFATSLWENDNSLLKSDGDILVGGNMLSAGKVEENSIFSQKNSDVNRPDNVIFAGSKPSSSIGPSSLMGKVNISGFADDEKIDDLTVGKILEKEEDGLDFDLFGKTNVIQARSQGVALHQMKSVVNSITKTDLEISSEAELDKMAAVTIEKKEKPPVTVFVTALPEIPAPAPAAISVASLSDIDAYIVSESSSGGGGLFD